MRRALTDINRIPDTTFLSINLSPSTLASGHVLRELAGSPAPRQASSANLADAINMLTINADARQMAVRTLGDWRRVLSSQAA
jgi:hypothetical protein